MSQVSELLLEKFFRGQCTERETEVVLAWLLDPNNRRLARAVMQKKWETLSGTDGDKVDVEALLAKTRARLASAEAHTRKRKWYASVSLRVAAALLFILISLALVMPVLKDSGPQFLALTPGSLKVSTSTGQIILKVLPDGTKVWLNAQSKLSYPEAFGETREVTLEGEAFFDVAEDTAHPFIVHADDIDIRVVGTAFNIKSYPGDSSIATTLVRGKVIIENRKRDTITKVALEPDEQAVFSHSSKDISLYRVDANKFSSWTNGSLVFEDDYVYEVFKTLERWYGVTIRTEDGANLTCRLTARIDKESLTETLELLRSITGIRYSVAGTEVTIEGKVCTP